VTKFSLLKFEESMRKGGRGGAKRGEKQKMDKARGRMERKCWKGEKILAEPPHYFTGGREGVRSYHDDEGQRGEKK